MKAPRGLSIVVLLIGIVAGIGGGVLYAWVINPVVHTDVLPWQLNRDGRTAWMIAVSVAWAHDGDIIRAANRLNDLHLSDQTFQVLADSACTLARSSYAQSQAGLIAIRSMVRLAQGQGKRGCASDLIGANTPTAAPAATVIQPTATLPPPPSKTPTQPPVQTSTLPPVSEGTVTPTAAAGDFRVVRLEPYCSAKTPGLIEVLVQEADGSGLPGIAVQVSWSGGTDRFYTGLKPENNDGYADFSMQPDETYTVVLPGLGERSSPLKASACTDRSSGASVIASYRVFFRRTAR